MNNNVAQGQFQNNSSSDQPVHHGKGVGKQYIGIGRIGAKVNEGPQSQRIKKPTFNASDGRDYSQDAPANMPVNAKAPRIGSSHSNRSGESEKKGGEDFAIPAIKSPAQVAAEKAAEWKRQQLEAEAAKKNKSYIKKKANN